LYAIGQVAKNIEEVIIVKKDQNKGNLDKNFFKAASYELAGDIGILDNGDMIDNKKSRSGKGIAKGNIVLRKKKR
jgi:hypothetical protein